MQGCLGKLCMVNPGGHVAVVNVGEENADCAVVAERNERAGDPAKGRRKRDGFDLDISVVLHNALAILVRESA